MTQEPDKITALYDDVKSEYEVGSIDDFKKYLSDPNKRSQFYNDVVKERYDVKSLDEFENVYQLKKKVSSEDVGSSWASATTSFVKPLKSSSEDIGQDYENVLKSVSQKGADAASILPSAISKLESMPTWAREKIINKQPILKPIDFQNQDYMAGENQKLYKNIPDMFDEQRKKNTKLILSKPSELDIIKDSSVGGIIQSVGNNYVEYSPDKSDVSFWKNIDLTDVPEVAVNFGNKDNQRITGNVNMPLPIKKMVDDYLYYLDKNEPEEFKKFDRGNLSNEEKSIIILNATKHQQEKIKAEYSAKKYKGGALNKLDSDISDDWAWEEQDALDAIDKITEISEDYLYRREGKGNEIGEAYRNAEKREINKEYEQKITDAKYDAYVNRGGIAASPFTGLYYNIVQPSGERVQDALRGVLTLPRTIGLDEVAPEIFGRIVQDSDKFLSPSETETPTALKADLLGKDGFNFTSLIPKLAATLTDFALLMLGTKGLTSAGMGSNASLMAASFASTNDNLFNEGVNAGMTKGEATIYSNIGSLVQAALERFSPNSNLLNGYKTKITPLILKDIAEGKAIKESYESRVREYLKEEGQEYGQLFAGNALNYVTNKVLNTNLKTDITANDMFETGVLTFANQAFANYATLKPVSDFNSSAVYSLSMMDDASREKIISDGIERGTITRQQGQELIDGTNEVRRVLKGIPDKYSANQKMELAGKIYQKQREIKKNKEVVVDSNFKDEQPNTVEKIDAEIKNLKEEYDSENRKEPIPGEVGKGEELKQAESVKGGGVETISPSGDVQAYEKEVGYDIKDGHHRYIAYKELGAKEVPVIDENGNEVMVPIEQLKPTQPLQEKDRKVIEGLKESIVKGEKVEPINVINKSNINEKVSDQKGQQEGLLKTEATSPSIEGAMPVAGAPVKVDKPSIIQNTKSEVDRVIASEPNADGDGQTFNLDGTTHDKGGLVIPVISENLKVSELTPERIADFVEANQDKLGGNAVKVGIYKFPNGQDVSIDLNIVAPREMREEAIAFGREAGQESLFDLDTFENVKTGSDGKNPKSFTAQEFKDIAKRFSGTQEVTTETSVPAVEVKDERPATEEESRKWEEDITKRLDEEEKRAEQEQAKEEKQQQPAKSEKKITEENKAKLKDQGEKITKALKAIDPKVEVIIYETQEEFEEAAYKAAKEAGADEETAQQNKTDKGFFDPNTGKIHINGAKFITGENTLLHEGVHPILNAIEAINPQIIEDLYNQLKEIESDLGIDGRYTEYFAGSYDQEVRKMEALTEFIADVANGDIPLENKTTFEKVKDFFRKMLKAVGINMPVNIKTPNDLVQLAKDIKAAFEEGRTIKGLETDYVDSNGNIITSKQLQSSIHNDFSDVKTKTTFTYLANNEEFKKLINDGTITNDKKLYDFNGKYIFLHSPDGAFTGMIYKNGELLVEGKGGIFYPIKFHKDGYFWASTKSGAASMVKQLNESAILNGGKVYMALISAPSDKLLSSTTAANAVLDIFSSKVFDKNVKIGESDIKSAIIKSAKSREIINGKNVGLGLKVDTKGSLEDIKNSVKEKLSPENSSFADRKYFVEQVIKNVVDNIKGKKSEQKLAEFLHLGISNKEMKGITKEGYKLSKANVVSAISHMLQEPLLRNDKKAGSVYAILELDGKSINGEVVDRLDSKKHESYPVAIKAKDGVSKTKLHILQDRNAWNENFIDPKTGEIVSKERELNIFPTSGVSTSPLKLSVKPLQSRKSLVEDTKKNKFMTEDGEGNYVFYHYATQDLSKKGINPLAPRSNATGKDEQPLAPASYYYTEPDIKESMVRGQFTHIVKVPKDKVYPFDEDPLNLLPAAEKAFKKAYPNVGFDANKMVAWVSKEAEKRGYPITVSNWAGVSGVKNALRAQSPVAQKPIVISKPVPNTLNQTVSDPNFEYKSNRRKRSVQPRKSSPKDGKMQLPIYVTGGAMKAMKAAVSKSKNLTDITQAGIDYVKSTDWYLSMGTNDQMDVIDMIEHKFGNIYKTGVKGDGVITAETIDEALKKGIKVGERKEKAAQKDLTQQIKDVLRKPSIITKLSLPQYKALVNEARNVTNEKQLEEYKAKVGEILEKQSEKNIAKTKKDAANNNKTKIKKAAKNEKAFANDIPVLKEFARINPAYLDDIDQYNEIAEQLLNKQDRTISNDDVMNYVEMKQKEIEEKLKQKLLSANDDLLKNGTITENMTLQEMRDALEGYKISIGEAKTPEEKLALRAERKEEKRIALQETIDQKLEELNKQLEGETLSTRKQEVIDSLNSIDRTNIKDEILQLMNRVIDNIIVNDSYARSGDIIIAYKTQEAIREAKFRLEELGYDSFDEFMDDEGNTFSKLLKYAQQKGYNTSQITDAIEKYNQLKGLIRNITDMQGLFSGHADMIEQIAEFSNNFNKQINKRNSGFVSQVRQALYSFVSQNYGGTDQDIQNDFNINKERLFESVKNSLIEVIEKVHAKKYRGRKSKGWSLKDKDNFVDAVKEIKFLDASRLKELLNLIPRNAIKPSDIANLEVYLDIIDPAQSAEEVRDQLNQDEKDLVDFMRKEFSKIKESLFETSEIWDNEVPEFVQNYLPLVYEKLSTVSKVTTKQSIDEQIKANSFAGGTINKSASGTTINRDRKNKLADDKKISTNFHYDMSRKFREALYQINTLPSRRTFGQIINDKGFRKILGGGNSDILHNYVVENIKTQLNITTADPMYTILSRTLSKIASSGSRMALGTFLFGRINQAAPPIIGAAIKMAGKGGGSIFIVPNKPNKNLFKHSNIKEALQTGAGFKTDYTVRDKRNIDDANIIKKGIRSLFSGADIASEALNNFTLSEVGKGDALGRRRAWMMYYKHYQKTRNNVKGFKWKNEYKNPNKAASAYADQQIESTQSSNTFSALSPILTKGRNFGDLIKNMYLGFQTFAITTRARLLNDTENLIKGIYSGDKKLIGESLQDITAVTVEFTTFATLKVAQGAFLTMLTVPLVKAILGIGDDEAEELVKQISFEDALKRIGGTVTRDLLFSGIPLADSPGAWFVNLAYKELSGADKNILYYKGQEDLNWFDGFGTYSPFLGSWASLATTAYKMKYGVPKLEKGGVIKKEGGAEIGTRALNERERDIYNVLLVHDMMRVLGIGDQSVNTIANKLRRIAEKEHAIGVFEGLYDPNKKKEEKPSGRSRSRLERAKQEKVKQEKSE